MADDEKPTDQNAEAPLDLNGGYGPLDLSQRRREKSSGAGLIPTLIESFFRGLGG